MMRAAKIKKAKVSPYKKPPVHTHADWSPNRIRRARARRVRAPEIGTARGVNERAAKLLRRAARGELNAGELRTLKREFRQATAEGRRKLRHQWRTAR